MTRKNTARTRPKRNLSVAPITSREKIGDTTQNLTLLRALKSRYKVVNRYAQELKQLSAAIKALGGDPDV